MANTLTSVIPQLLAQGLMALRENAIMPLLVNRDLEGMAARKGATIDVPIPSAITAVSVSPGATPPATADISPTSVPVPLNQWFEAPFYLTDRDIMEAMEGTIPMEASEAIKALANNVDVFILGLFTGIYSQAGTPGTVPFSTDTVDATDMRKLLHNTLAPPGDRRVVLDPDAEANALNLRAFQDASWSASAEAIMNGNLNRKLGFQWFMDQNAPSHTNGSLTDTASMACLIMDATIVVGQTVTTCDESTLTGDVNVGDIFTVAGDTQQYVITAAATASSNAITLTHSPGAKVAWADGAQVTFAGGISEVYAINLGFHRDAFAFASRPLVDSADGLGNQIASIADPISGLSLRLEVSREHKRTRFSYDILYGAALVRAELATRLAG